MLEPQGPRPFEPYRILQLQPHASQDLIIESYWTLVARAKAHDNDAAIRALNAAYELLTNADRRTAYDREHGHVRDDPPPEKKQHRGRKSAPAPAPDHYHLLAVDREADADVIELAYRIAVRKAAGHHPELVLLREQLADAFHTLSNQQSRAAYDAAIAMRPPESPLAPDGASAGGVPDFLSKEHNAHEGGESNKRGVLGLFGRGTKKQLDERRPTTSGGAALPPRVSDESARGDRLLQLRPFGAEVLVGAMRQPPAKEQPPMAVLVIVGPAGEERVPLPPRTITIGSSDENDIVLPGRNIAPEQVRMWPHGDSFAMRVTGRGHVRVGGVEPALAVVLLEDGDKIEMSAYQLTFHNAPRT